MSVSPLEVRFRGFVVLSGDERGKYSTERENFGCSAEGGRERERVFVCV